MEWKSTDEFADALAECGVPEYEEKVAVDKERVRRLEHAKNLGGHQGKLRKGTMAIAHLTGYLETLGVLNTQGSGAIRLCATLTMIGLGAYEAYKGAIAAIGSQTVAESIAAGFETVVAGICQNWVGIAVATAVALAVPSGLALGYYGGQTALNFKADYKSPEGRRIVERNMVYINGKTFFKTPEGEYLEIPAGAM